MRVFWILIAVMFVGACAWVKPSPRSEQVRVATPAEVVNCVKKGTTSVTTVEKIMFIPRSGKKIQEELLIMARNEALILKGDRIVAEGEPVDAQLTYSVYQCQ